MSDRLPYGIMLDKRLNNSVNFFFLNDTEVNVKEEEEKKETSMKLVR